MNTVLITEIKCVMLFLSFLISVMWYTLEKFLTGQRGLIKFYAEDNICLGAAPTCALELELLLIEYVCRKDFNLNLKFNKYFTSPTQEWVSFQLLNFENLKSALLRDIREGV